MGDLYYIIITVIFGVFVLLTLWWLYKYINKKSILEMKREDLTEDQKIILTKFCNEMRNSKVVQEQPSSKTPLTDKSVNSKKKKKQA